MKKRIFSILLALTLCLTPVLAGVSSALAIGDIDGDSKISSDDARLALRSAVKLQTLNAEQTKAGDVDFDGKVTSDDARLILRAAVGLDTLVDKNVYFNGHPVESDSIGIEKGIVCIDPECECGGSTLMPSFNELVNALKTPGSTNYFYGFSKTVTSTPKPTCKASSALHFALAELMEGLLADSVTAETITDYTDMTNRRHINNATFFVTGKKFVSDLKEGDVASIKTEKMNGVDFVKNLPASYVSTQSNTTVDLSKIKASVIGDVYKVTVTLRPETITNKNIPTDVTPIEKILNANYNKGIKSQMDSLNSSFSDMPEMADMFVMEMDITTECTVEYYFTADTFAPVAARYYTAMKTSSYMHTYFNIAFVKTDKATTTTTIKNDSVQEDFFFFNDFFTVK